MVILVAPIDTLEVLDPVITPLDAEVGNVTAPFNVKTCPFNTKSPLEKEQDVLTVTFPPRVTVPKLPLFTVKDANVNGEAEGVIVPKLPLPPILKLEVVPPVIVPAPAMVPLKFTVTVLVVLNASAIPLPIFNILLTVVLAVFANFLGVPVLDNVKL